MHIALNAKSFYGKNSDALDELVHDPTGELDDFEIVELYENTTDRLVEILFENSANGKQFTTKSTPEHPFFVYGKGWVAAERVQGGDECRSASGSRVAVVSVTVLNEACKVYNFQVKTAHTYFVGETDDESVLVHNFCYTHGYYFYACPECQVDYTDRSGSGGALFEQLKLNVKKGDPRSISLADAEKILRTTKGAFAKLNLETTNKNRRIAVPVKAHSKSGWAVYELDRPFFDAASYKLQGFTNKKPDLSVSISQNRLNELQSINSTMIKVMDILESEDTNLFKGTSYEQFSKVKPAKPNFDWSRLRGAMVYAQQYKSESFDGIGVYGNVSLVFEAVYDPSSYNFPLWPGIALNAESFYGKNRDALVELIHEPLHNWGQYNFDLVDKNLAVGDHLAIRNIIGPSGTPTNPTGVTDFDGMMDYFRSIKGDKGTTLLDAVLNIPFK